MNEIACSDSKNILALKHTGQLKACLNYRVVSKLPDALLLQAVKIVNWVKKCVLRLMQLGLLILIFSTTRVWVADCNIRHMQYLQVYRGTHQIISIISSMLSQRNNVNIQIHWRYHGIPKASSDYFHFDYLCLSSERTQQQAVNYVVNVIYLLGFMPTQHCSILCN